jgi:aminoglycoside/choline kinase family phosphotransferase
MARVGAVIPGEERRGAMARFLAAQGWGGSVPAVLAGDASFRRYYRLIDGSRRAVLMDAPPPQEDVRPYVSVATILRAHGFSAPEIYAEDRERGFLLIEDFGDDTYTKLLANMPCVLGAELGPAARDDYLARWREVLPYAELPAPTLVLRDYHVDNLMLLPDRSAVQSCGLLDFQDAVRGPASYDLVSLLEDARRDVPTALRSAMTERYLGQFPDLDPARFRRSASILAAQRNCKIIGIFTRLWRRDGKPGYLAHIPRVWRLLEEDLREPASRPVADWLDRHLPAPVRRAPASGAA